MSKGKQLLAGASWVYASQLSTVVVQMIYAAITSRLVDPSGFAAYGVALAVGALALVLSNGGLGQAVGRMTDIDPLRVRFLTAYAATLGLLGACALYVSASFWAELWGTPAAADPIRIMAMVVLIAPISGVAAGLLRRQGRFRFLSLTTFLCNALGMLVGTLAVFLWRSAEALLISNLAAQAAVMLVCTARNFKKMIGPFPIVYSGSDLTFSWKLTLASIAAYCNGNVGKLAVSRALGGGALGYWNRADVVTTVPFMQVQNAIIQAVYPEFRHDIKDNVRARTIWTDLLTLVAWLALPTAALASVVIPPIARMIFGSGWSVSIALSAPLALIAGIQIVSTVLASAIEALGKFKWVWSTQVILFAIYALAAIWCFQVREWYPILAGLFAAQICQHILHIWLCQRHGYIDAKVLTLRYMRITLFSAAVVVVAQLVVAGLDTPHSMWVVVATSVAIPLLAWQLWKVRFRLEPIRIVSEYRRR